MPADDTPRSYFAWADQVTDAEAAVPAPRPLTAEDSDLIDRIGAWCDECWAEPPIIAKELLYETFGALLGVQAEVRSLRTRLAAATTQRDAAHRVARRLTSGWAIEPYVRQVWTHVDRHAEPIDPDEAAVLDAIRDSDDA